MFRCILIFYMFPYIFIFQLDLPKLNESIKNESEEREEMDSNIMKKTTEELLKMSNAI